LRGHLHIIHLSIIKPSIIFYSYFSTFSSLANPKKRQRTFDDDDDDSEDDDEDEEK